MELVSRLRPASSRPTPSAPLLHDNQGQPPPPYPQYNQAHPRQNYASLGPVGPVPINAAGGHQQNYFPQQQQPYQQLEGDIYFQQPNIMPNQQNANANVFPVPEPGDNRPKVEEVETNIRMSICCCITWILLLALPAIPFGLCAFFCSLYSISLRKKGDTERANKRGSNAMCAIITSVPVCCIWAFVLSFSIIFLICFIILFINSQHGAN